MSEAMIPLSVAVLTVSDSRTEETDRSGQALVERLEAPATGCMTSESSSTTSTGFALKSPPGSPRPRSKSS